ncbi:LPXTG cell wall anchor domain-containing protein [Clostridium cavendishii]
MAEKQDGNSNLPKTGSNVNTTANIVLALALIGLGAVVVIRRRKSRAN